MHDPLGATRNMDIPILPHEHEPGVECCGCLVPREYGGDIELFCNECGAIVVRGEEKVDAYARRFLGDPTKVPMHICPHCGALKRRQFL